MARLDGSCRNAALTAVARALEAEAGSIAAANRRDLEAARAEVARGAMSESLYARLVLDEPKVAELAVGVRQLATLADPVGKVTLAVELDEGLILERVTCPIGVVGVVFESRPDALVQIAGLCLKSGNAVLLKGGGEAAHSNRALFDLVERAALGSGIPEGALALLESREHVDELLRCEGSVDLIVPRGSNALVRYVRQRTSIPVLGHAEGICHVYVDAAADVERALAVTLDAKLQYPAACNAAETLLVHRAAADRFLPRALAALKERGVAVRTEGPWNAEYGDLVIGLRIVDSIDDAIAHINRYGSRHTDTIVTEDDAAWRRFFAEVDSAGVFRNASTRFADGFRYGFGAEVGISTGKLHPRGPVGLEGLVTYKYRLTGKGHVVSDYIGEGAKRFTHRPLSQ
jgi:glutamate-5-semialdehyde dehydrogenase